MKIVVGVLLIIARLYCGVKILTWLVQQNFSTNHPISEIYQVLVFIILDIWISTVGKVTEEIN